MKILLVAEGPHELGARDEFGRPLGPSALETFCRRLMECDAEFVRMKVSDPGVRIHASRGRADGYERRAQMWLRRAEREGFDALILVIDQDNDEARIQQLDLAQRDDRFPIRRALGVAVRTFDAWMLADETALLAVFGVRVPRHRNLEALSDAKAICRQVIQQGDLGGLASGEAYARLAEAIELRRLEERCPQGFRPFAQRVRVLVER